jgi:hypothetical protein
LTFGSPCRFGGGLRGETVEPGLKAAAALAELIRRSP